MIVTIPEQNDDAHTMIFMHIRQDREMTSEWGVLRIHEPKLVTLNEELFGRNLRRFVRKIDDFSLKVIFNCNLCLKVADFQKDFEAFSHDFLGISR